MHQAKTYRPKKKTEINEDTCQDPQGNFRQAKIMDLSKSKFSGIDQRQAVEDQHGRHNHLKMIQFIRDHGLMYDYYWLDAGWFGLDHETDEFQNFHT